MYAPTMAKAFLLSLPIITPVLSLSERDSCSGVLQSGYCCDGSVFKKDHSNDISAANLICCQGDPHQQINFAASAPTSCTAGTQIPLTEASGGDASQSTGSSGGDTNSASSANDAVHAVITAGPLVGAAALAGAGVLLGA